MSGKNSLLIFALLLLVNACSKATSKPSYLFKPAAKEGVAAKVGDIEITNQELMSGIESEVFELESKIFETKFSKLQSILIKKFAEKDSRSKGLSTEDFISKFIAKDVKVADKSIDAFIVEQKIPKEHINPQVREKIKVYLENEEKKQLVERWLAAETSKSPVEVYLTKPRRPTFEVTVGNAPFAGDKDAKVTIVEFSDFQCPFCAKGADLLKKIKQKYGSKVKVAFKNFPLPFHQYADLAALAGLCANEQSTDLFWKLHDEMFANQESLNLDGLKKLGKKVGVKSEAFDKCLADKKYSNQVQQDMDEGKKVGVRSTPTFFVNGQLISGAQDLQVFADLIDEELAK